jgi:hypothetical protein
MHGAKSIVLVKMNGLAANLVALGRPARLVRVRASCVTLLAALAWTSPIIESSNGRVRNAISTVHKNTNYSHRTNPIDHHG